MAVRTQADPDLWGHVRYGLDILDQRALPRTDPYSYLTIRTWINHEWLAEVLMGGVWRLGGAEGLVWLKLGVVAGTMTALLAALRLQGSSIMMRPWLAIIAMVLLMRNFITIRPQMFTALSFSALILVLVSVESGKHFAIYALPPLFATWVNLHGGVLQVYVFWDFWLVGRVVSLRRAAWREVAGVHWPSQRHCAIRMAWAYGASSWPPPRFHVPR